MCIDVCACMLHTPLFLMYWIKSDASVLRRSNSSLSGERKREKGEGGRERERGGEGRREVMHTIIA